MAIFLMFVFCGFAPQALANDNGKQTGRLEGTVFVGDEGHQSYMSGTKVLASDGPVQFKTVTNADGKFVFVALPPGTYTIEASSAGLEAIQTIAVQANQAVQVPLHLRPTQVNTSVTVNASETDAKSSAPMEIINEKTVRDAPNMNERFDTLLPLVPGVVRGPDGHINLKGASSTQSGSLVNGANVTDPATGSSAINLPIDVVSSVHVMSNPYDPQYGKFTGAVSSVETKTGNYEKYHFSIQNVLPRWRNRDGHIIGIGAATPRMTFTGPLIKNRIAFTQSLEYRFVRTPVNSLPPLQRDTTLQGYNSYTQFDLNLSSRQTATVSFVVYPQKLKYMGLDTFTPQPATADFHQRGYQIYGQHRYVTGPESALVSQLSYKRYDADVTAQSDDPYQLLIDTTNGGFFNRQGRRTYRLEGNESYEFSPRHFLGTHQMRAGLNYAYASYDGREAFLPVEIIGVSGAPIERIHFTDASSFNISQNETSWFLSDRWALSQRITFDLGMRFDSDTITGSTNVAPRAGFLLALTNDGRTLLKGGVGMFYDRVPLIIPIFKELPNRTVSLLDTNGQASSSISYVNQITGGLRNPQSTSWSIALERQVLESLTLRVAYEQRNTSKVFVVSPTSNGSSGILALSNYGRDSYRELQVAGRYKLSRITLNSSYVHSRAYGNLNDPSLFFGNYPQAVIPPDARARLPFDVPNRFLTWGDIEGPWKLSLLPVYDLHTGFPYSAKNEFREYVGPPNNRRYPWFSSLDLQVLRPVSLHLGERHLHMRAGFSVFNVFNHFNPRDVQNVEESTLFGDFFNNAWREYRGKLVFQF
ncbi:TonB-dependent receptor [Edaphobacter aggregans]|uniref:TonB-dependent receptor n=1 Tax=Edaphobacter aggregans TaxID=570835 RepID=UPI0005516D76|nr:carboxypeptidase regulatory-like domain-containing protein [Edaphobacter aggregans]